jgi:probable HAF family extracellular repeat protein
MLNSRHLGALIPAVVFTCLGLPVHVLAADYTLTDLGTLTGDDYSCGYGINASGQVTGESVTTGVDGHAFLYDGTSMQDLGTLGGTDSFGQDVNDSGQVVGWSFPAGPIITFHAFLYDSGSMQDLNDISGTDFLIATGINNNGEVTGWGDVPPVPTQNRAFLYDSEGMQDLGTLGGNMSFGSDVNDNGQVVGWSNPTGSSLKHAFLYSDSVMQDLGTLGGDDSEARGINNSGQVVGFSQTTGNTAWRAFLHNGTSMQDLGTLGGDNSKATSINNSGQVVGYTFTGNDVGINAFLYDGATIQDLCTLSDCTTVGWSALTKANDINDDGAITGCGVIGGETHAFLAVPTAASFVWGDIDGDDVVNAVDVLLATRAVTGGLALNDEQLTRGNVAPLVDGVPDPADPLAPLDAADLLLITRKATGASDF